MAALSERYGRLSIILHWIALALSSSLIGVAAFGMTTAVSYAAAGLVDWTLAGLFIFGGVAGGMLGSRLALKISAHKNLRFIEPLTLCFGSQVDHMPDARGAQTPDIL